MMHHMRPLSVPCPTAAFLSAALTIAGLGIVTPTRAEQPSGAQPVKLLTGDGTLVFPQPSIDLGVHPDTQPIYHTFSFTNTSKQRVKLEITFCHFCTPPTLSKDVLEPGESGTLLVEINPAGRTGEMRANATVAVVGNSASAVMVEAKVEIRPRVWVEPVQFFPKIIRGEPMTSRAIVTGRSSDFAVTRVECDTPGITAIATSAELQTEPTGGKVYRSTLTITYGPELPLGPLGAQIHVHTNDAESDAKLITIDGEVVGRISIDPPRRGQRLATGAVWGAVFELVGNGGDLVVESAEIAARDEAGSVAIDVLPGADPSRAWVMVSGTAPLREREACDLRATITARSGRSGELETVTLPIVLVVHSSR